MEWVSAQVVVNTWAFTQATDAGWKTLQSTNQAVSAVEDACKSCESDRCDGTVGWGGSPDEHGETTLDAVIMDGTTFDSGAVAGLRNVRDAVSVARAVMEHSEHSILAGELAADFAVSMGFNTRSLSSNESERMFETWKANNCQPNFWRNVIPDSATSCGPYSRGTDDSSSSGAYASLHNHDTISVVAVDSLGNIAAASSSNGANHKIPGRVGDAAIVGAGSYADSSFGGCGATGDGDIMMRFLPCYQAVQSLAHGLTPQQAAEAALRRIGSKFPDFHGGIIVVNNKGDFGAAGWGWRFVYSSRTLKDNQTQVHQVESLGPKYT